MWFAKRAFPHQLGGVLQLPRHRMNAGDCQSFVSGQWWQQLRQLVRQMGFSAAWWTNKKQMMPAGRGQGERPGSQAVLSGDALRPIDPCA